MKHILIGSLAILAALTCSCGGNSNRSRSARAAAGVASLVKEAEAGAASPVMSLFDAAPASLAEDIIRQLPPELLPEPNDEGKDGITQLLESTAGNAPAHADWYEFFGECDVVGISTHAFPRKDGSWLFFYVDGAGCDCYVQDEPRAFNYAGGKLTPCEWPIEKLEYSDFVSPLGEGLVEEQELAWIKDDWSINYNFGEPAPNMLRCTFLNIDYYNFTEGCRPICFEWDGSSFQRKDGRYGLIRDNGFAQFSPYGYVEDIPEGFEVKGKGRHQSLVDKNTGETVCNFLIDADDAILEIEVVSPLYDNEHGFYPGQPLEDLEEEWSEWEFMNSEAYLRPNGDVVINFLGYQLLVDAKDIVGEPEGAEDKYPQWSYKPGAKLKGILIG